MTIYTFTLVPAGIGEIDETVEDRLYEGGCGDALLGVRDAVPFLDFDREAESLREAVLSAIDDLEGSGIGARVIRVEPDDLVTASDIASRTGRSRESIRLLAAGKRGGGGFPPPVHGVKSRSRLWRWAEVARWLAAHAGLEADGAVEDAQTIAAINGALELRRHARESTRYLVKRLVG